MIRKFLDAFLLRTYVIPFETMFAALSIYSGITRLADFGVTSSVIIDTIGHTAAQFFSLAYLLGGIGMLVGLGTGRRNIEAFGLCIVSASILIGIIATIFILGFVPAVINGLVTGILFLIACAIRAHSIMKGGLHLVVLTDGKVTTK